MIYILDIFNIVIVCSFHLPENYASKAVNRITMNEIKSAVILIVWTYL